LILALTMGLSVAARSEPMFKADRAADKAARKAVLRNEWLSNLPYVTDVEWGPLVCGNETKEYDILVMTDTEDHKTLLEKQVPGSLEGFPVIVVVDRSEQWNRQDDQMYAKARTVVYDPANKWILKIPHVTRMEPSTVKTKFGEPITPAVAIVVDHQSSLKEVQSKVPKTIGGFPTTFGQVDDWGEWFHQNREGDDRNNDNENDDDQPDENE